MKVIVFVGCLCAAAAAAHGAQDPLGAAKDLYASAASEEALATLARVSESRTIEIAREVDQYRAFCLYALGRTAEAEAAAESVIRKDPLMPLIEADSSPRIQAMFTTVRKRLLPGLIREKYRAAKSALDAKHPNEAEPHLLEARRMLAEAEKIDAWDDALADLRVLVDGFLDLTQARAQRTQPEATATRAAADPSAAVVATVPAAPPLGGSEAAERIYSSADRDVAPPVAVRQVIPAVPQRLLDIMRISQTKGTVLEVLVDETGGVQQADLQDSLNPAYDDLLVAAARNWKYRPATKAGVPVRYMKAINVNVAGRE
jgi:tetratricopeptide (TPR) repeat protein